MTTAATATRPLPELLEPETPADLVVVQSGAPPLPPPPRVQVMPPAQPAVGPAVAASSFTSSEEIGQLLAAFAIAQGKFAPVIKDQEANIVSKRTDTKFSYGYASLAVVLNAVRPALSENGIALLQIPITGQSSVKIITFLGHASGEWMRSELVMPGLPADPQELGKAVTYLRRISAKAILGVADEDDDGEGETRARANQVRPGGTGQGPVSMPQRAQPTSPQSGASAGAPRAASPEAAAPAAANSTPTPAPASFTIDAIEPRQKADKTPYWVIAFSNNLVACTFRPKMAEQLAEAKQRGIRYSDAVTTKKGNWTFLDSLQPADGAQ